MPKHYRHCVLFLNYGKYAVAIHYGMSGVGHSISDNSIKNIRIFSMSLRDPLGPKETEAHTRNLFKWTVHVLYSGCLATRQLFRLFRGCIHDSSARTYEVGCLRSFPLG